MLSRPSSESTGRRLRPPARVRETRRSPRRTTNLSLRRTSCTRGRGEDLDASRAAFLFQHPDDVLRRAVAEQLSQRFFVIRDAMLFDERDEVLRRVARQRRLAEMRVRRKEIFRPAMQVGEVAAAAAGDQDFLADAIGVFEHGDAASAFAGGNGAHQAGRASAQHYRVIGMDHKPVSSFAVRVSSTEYGALRAAKFAVSSAVCDHARSSVDAAWVGSSSVY